MKNIYRILFSLTVFLSGVALVPVMGLPTAGFTWQQYADAYVLTTLEVNHQSGQPGSFFTITGTNYPADATMTIQVNGASLGSVQSDENGNLLFVINTTGANPGYYTVVLDPVNDVYTRFVLRAGDTLWPQDATAPVVQLPADIANQLILMPSVHR